MMNERFGQQAIRRQVGVLLLSLGVLVMTAGIINATHSPGEGPPGDFVAGTGTAQGSTFTVTFQVNATSGPSGEDAKGHFVTEWTFFDLRLSGRVFCLEVEGESALVGGVVQDAQGSGHTLVGEGSLIFFKVRDQGEPPPDPLTAFMSFVDPETQDFVECEDWRSLLDCEECVFPITKGNFVVHDALP